MPSQTVIVITARNEADRLPATIAGLRRAFSDAPIVVADDGSSDATASVAAAQGAAVASTAAPLGKGGAATLAARRAVALGDQQTTFVLCDGDLGASAEQLVALAEAVRDGADVAVAAFTRRLGGGFGLAVACARWAIRSRTGLRLRAPLSGQRALSARAFEAVLPFAPGFGMEVGMTIDAARAGLRLVEVELDLEHRSTGRDLAGFVHRARQLRDVGDAWLRRRR
jgi:glycosyltransferase involved in cell wall biosynthesis